MKFIIGIVIGSTIGFGIGYFGRCVSGSCPLTSNPLVSAFFGGLLGLLLMLGK